MQFRNHGSHFEKHKTAFEEGGGRDEAMIEDEVEGKDVESSSRAESIRVEDEKRVSDEQTEVV